ncbi:CDP-glycerol glycerophosphotransferase family protein [uncultured Friedmanniella sp.]|uniref:CDP-glycerol glycerophosphotransferase family protein n=1 Tax=uncultured Friedmanniella sp. TaxID=335381 RepID=UPI0035CA6EE8
MKVVYNAFNGRYADNPRAVFETWRRSDPDATHTWLADSRQAAGFPTGVTTVPIRSAAASAALEDADLVVANCHTDLDPWQKKPGARYLQTWHGTPLKRIHRAAVSQPAPALMDALDAEIATWDHLLSPSPAATRLLRRAFGYAGSVLETGYPRNDVLSAADAPARRARVRRRLGISDGTTAVLYAPTYRDDDVSQAEGAPGLDLAELTRRLGPGHVVLLRRHYYLGHRRPLAATERLRDVSAETDIAELYLAADALVTDYSSSVFDFAVTGKPIVMFAYDLAHYRDRLRGFTLDLATELPGPVVDDPAELADLVADLRSLQTAFAERYRAFAARYTRLEDGHASDRVVAALSPTSAQRLPG